MLHRLHALGGKSALALVLGGTLLLAACGTGSTPSGSTTPANASLTACTVKASDLTIPGGGTASATATSGLTGQTLTIQGSTALAPLFQDAATAFDAANGTHTSVTPNGSGTGLTTAESGAAQIGMSDVFAKEKAPASNPNAYADLVDHQVAAVAFTLVTSSDLVGKVNNLTTAQVREIYLGQVTNWSQLGGPNEAITVINRTSTSGTRATFKKYVLGGQTENAPTAQTQDTSGQVAAAVSTAQGAIAYVATSFVASNSTLAPICIDGYGATVTNINSGKYTFWSYEHAYTKGQPSGAAAAFLAFVTSSSFQSQDLAAKGFIQIGNLSSAAQATHPAP